MLLMSSPTETFGVPFTPVTTYTSAFWMTEAFPTQFHYMRRLESATAFSLGGLAPQVPRNGRNISHHYQGASLSMLCYNEIESKLE